MVRRRTARRLPARQSAHAAQDPGPRHGGARVRGPARPRRPGREQITVFAREVADPDGLDRPFLVFLQGGPGFEASRPTRHPSSPGWLDRALEEFRVLHARPARHGPVDAGRHARRADAARAGRPPRPLPRRRDRPRRRAHPRRARRRALERARPELRRVLRDHATCRSRPTGCARRSSPAGCRRSAATSTTSTAPRTRARSSATAATTSATRSDRERVARARRARRACGCPAATGSPLAGCARSAASSG